MKAHTSKSAIEPERAFILLAVLLVCAGIVLRFIDLGFPEHLTFDEHHFVKNARNYLSGKADWNDHPPLGKLLMALSASTLGDQMFSFRLPSALLGCGSIVAGGFLCRAVFQSNLGGLLAAAFVAADGFLIAYSRTALLDGMLTAVSLATLLAMTMPGWAPVLLTGLLLGSALSIKFSAITLMGPFMGIFVLRVLARSKKFESYSRGVSLFGRDVRGSVGELISVPIALCLMMLVYLSWWSWGLSLAGQDASFQAGLDSTQRLMEHHAKLTEWNHPLLSRWWTWPVPTNPIMLRYDLHAPGMVRVMTMMGNPLLWWSGVLAAVATLYVAVRQVAVGFAQDARTSPKQWGPAWLLLAYVAYLSPWIVTNRDSYIYHYLPAYAISLVLLGGWIGTFARRQQSRFLSLIFLCAVTVVSAFYAPVWAQLPLSESALGLRPLIR